MQELIDSNKALIPKTTNATVYRMAKKNLTYQSAMEELEGILEQMEENTVEIDQLSITGSPFEASSRRGLL